MAKSKKTTEPHYELLYIISNKFTEDEAKAIAQKIEALVVSNEGAVTYREDWGKKKLAYPIDHFGFGYYMYVEFDVNPLKILKIERSIRLMHEVIRHQILTRQTRTVDMKEKPKVLFTEELKRVETSKEPEKTSNKPLAENISETPVAEVATQDLTETQTLKPTKESKSSMEELDAKLDKILETDDLI